MEIFTWMPGSPETIEEFNARVAEFCLAENSNVVDVASALAGPAILLSLTQAEDLVLVSPMVLLPIVVLLDKTDIPRLEAKLTEICDVIKGTVAGDGDPWVPVTVRAHVADASWAGYAVVLVNIASLEEEGQ